MKTPPTQRQLKVGEVIKRILSEMFIRGEIVLLDGTPITVSLVKIAPDLHNATAYIYPLGGKAVAEVLKILKANEGFIRKYVASRIELRTAPHIVFRLDDSYEEADRINKLLQKVNAPKKD